MCEREREKEREREREARTEGVGLLGETLLGEAIRGKLTFFSDLLGVLGVRMKGVGCDVSFGSRA